jgi:UDP-N-acetylmuramoyl-tripeptide--D-alanyl-D-alanine ligase
MGMYVGGEIADLARMARPRIGVVTAVQPVHLSRIGSIEAIEAAKGELLEALPADGAAILNADDPIVRRYGLLGPSIPACRTGSPLPPTSAAEDVETAGVDGMRFTLEQTRAGAPVTLPKLGAPCRSTTRWRGPAVRRAAC